MPLIVNGGIVLAMTSRSMLSCVTHTRRPTLTNSRFFRFSRHSRKVGTRNCNCCAATAKGIGESHSTYGGLSGEKDERVLPEWLNAARGTASYKRVIRILELIRQTEERFRDARARHAFVHVSKSDAPRKWPREKLQLQRAADKPHSDLARALKRYRFRIRLTMPSMDVHWLFNMYCLRRADDFCWETQYGFRVFEGDAVMTTSRLAERGLLSRVRVCATCSQWLFARHSNYKFCNSRCRERYYTSTDEYRARKAGHMRQYRERLRRRVETERANLLT